MNGVRFRPPSTQLYLSNLFYCMCIYDCSTIWCNVYVEACHVLDNCPISSYYKCRYILSEILEIFFKIEYTYYMKLLRILFFYKNHILTYHHCHVNCAFFSTEVLNKEKKSHKYVSSYFYSLWYIYTIKTYKNVR